MVVGDGPAVKLVNDGQALTYASPENPSLPKWAVWKNEALWHDLRADHVHL